MLSRDALVQMVALQYSSFELVANGVYWSAITRFAQGNVGVTGSSPIDILRSSANAFLSATESLLNAHAADLSGGDENVLNALETEVVQTVETLRAITQGVILQVLSAIKRERLKVASGIKDVGVYAGLRLKAHDMVGRSYDASMSVKRAARGFAVSAYIAERAISLKAQGFNQVIVVNEDGTAGEILSIDEFRASSMFHPNTNKKVKPHA